ncbi:MAG: 16S rRNA (uracil(1498)-N(3))-methyltransferase [Chitinophagales bacterium]|nr:16S rRNA (uracil(1498)-N(3))-methyltransferase [Chitinophagales bacterium]
MMRFLAKELTDTIAILGEEESIHASKVLRLKPGDRIEVFDGRGRLAQAEIHTCGKLVTARIIQLYPRMGNPHLFSIAIAPTKHMDRLEFFLEKATEIGVKNIYIIQTERTERAKVNSERLQKILLAATKQSGQLYIPELSQPINLKDLFKSTMGEEIRLIAHCNEVFPKEDIHMCFEKGKKMLILIGPEGDFTEKEITLSLENGCKSVNLASSRLRVETAGITALVQLNLLNNMLK